jgi:hypothetical protein
MANKDKMLNLPWQIGREFTVQIENKIQMLFSKEIKVEKA